jgi:hypothetical protein
LELAIPILKSSNALLSKDARHVQWQEHTLPCLGSVTITELSTGDRRLVPTVEASWLENEEDRRTSYAYIPY